MLLEKKRGTVRVPAGFFIGGEGEDQIPLRHEMLAPQTDERCDHGRVAILHVDGAAAVEPAVLLGELEGRDGPVFRLRLDDIEVAEEQHGFPGALALIANDQIAFVRMLWGAMSTTSSAAKPCDSSRRWIAFAASVDPTA